MPVKVKKEKKVIKKKPVKKQDEKLSQAQQQRQVVNVRIGDVKNPKRRRAVNRKATKPLIQQTVQPVQYLYQATGSIPQPFQNMGVGAEPRRSILAERPEVRQPQGIEQPLQLEVREPVRENLLGGGASELSREDISQRRLLRLSQPEEPSMFQDFPPPPLDILVPPPPLEALGGGGAILEDFPPPERFPTLGQIRTSPAREVRRALQISQGTGSDVPLELLIQGKYNLEGQPKRREPTVNQRVRLIEAGYQVKESTPKKKKEKKDA